MSTTEHPTTGRLSAEEILRVPGVISGGLAADLVARLPEHTPPAPWQSNISLAAWVFRSTPASAAALASPLAPGLGVGVAAFIDYLDGAVGPYREILASPRCVRVPGRRGLLGSVPFIAVDSIPSIHGGRTNWALPKLPAEFTGSPGAEPGRTRAAEPGPVRAAESQLSATGADWRVSAKVESVGPWLPFRAAGRAAQPWPDGGARMFRSAFRGRVRLARLTVQVTGSDELSGVLPGGRHLGVVIRGHVEVGAPTPV